MKRSTVMMRVPIGFKSEIMRIAQKRNTKATEILKDGIRIFQNADYLSDLIGRKFRRI